MTSLSQGPAYAVLSGQVLGHSRVQNPDRRLTCILPETKSSRREGLRTARIGQSLTDVALDGRASPIIRTARHSWSAARNRKAPRLLVFLDSFSPRSLACIPPFAPAAIGAPGEHSPRENRQGVGNGYLLPIVPKP
ncbi:hypothetical protein VTN77DRAFT_2505 [Rasamsonia byssochlamydoides]|uniref:uncharacterized protein n=1 Tax=Rasamsonia byssochlamydoides TaxID=89139 RepID=UPI00374403B9